MSGYAGKILRVDLTTRGIKTIATSKYKEWVGGHGMGSAIFYDLVVKENKINLEEIDGFHHANVFILMTSPLSGTMTPASPRTEVQGIGLQSYPIGWFTRSNFGGRFSAMLKYAQWDGIVIEGRASTPVWVDIRDDDVYIRECSELSLWGKDTWETQQIIFDYVAGKNGYGDWIRTKGIKRGGQTTQRPAVLAIGLSGENLSRMACLIHDTGCAAGQCGFGAVWGSKNLKAISVIGTGSIKIADPNALMEARLWSKKNYAFDPNNPVLDEVYQNSDFSSTTDMSDFLVIKQAGGARPIGCINCHAACKPIMETGFGSGTTCLPTYLYSMYTGIQDDYENTAKVADLVNRSGINAFELFYLNYLRDLYKMGVLGPGKEIDVDCEIDFENWGSLEFIKKLLFVISNRVGSFGDTLAEGLFRASEKWGRLEEDTQTGLLPYPYWGFPEHGYDPRNQIEWGYGTLLGDRDINEHCFRLLFWYPSLAAITELKFSTSADELTKIFTDKMVPFAGDQLMLDYSPENMYSNHIAKLVAWHRRYTRFWKESVLLCDFAWPDFYNKLAPDNKGMTPEGETKFFNAVTGMNISFVESMELGRKIWNLDNAIWVLQGRHRDMVHFSEYIYKTPSAGFLLNFPVYLLPGRENGEWKYIECMGKRAIDKDKFEEWKTLYYNLEGWDPVTGYPKRSTLESLNLKDVADELDRKGKLGSVN